MTGLGVVLGELICLGVLFRLTIELDPTASFIFAGATGFVLTTVLVFMIKEPERNVKRVVSKGEVADYD